MRLKKFTATLLICAFALSSAFFLIQSVQAMLYDGGDQGGGQSGGATFYVGQAEVELMSGNTLEARIFIGVAAEMVNGYIDQPLAGWKAGYEAAYYGFHYQEHYAGLQTTSTGLITAVSLIVDGYFYNSITSGKIYFSAQISMNDNLNVYVGLSSYDNSMGSSHYVTIYNQYPTAYASNAYDAEWLGWSYE